MLNLVHVPRRTKPPSTVASAPALRPRSRLALPCLVVCRPADRRCTVALEFVSGIPASLESRFTSWYVSALGLRWPGR